MSCLQRRGRRGTALVSAVVALSLTAVSLVVLLQGYTQGARLVATQQRRATALALCQDRLEVLRAGGYSSLRLGDGTAPAPGIPDGQLRTTVTAGPAPQTRQVVVTASWPAAEHTPAGQLQLATIFSERGLAR